MKHLLRACREDRPGPVWRGLFERFWPAYERWFLREGDGARPSLERSRSRLARYMGELVPTWERLVELAGGGARAARFLSLYRPSPYLSACSQAVFAGEEPVLVRNYDYSPSLWEGTLVSSAWNGRRVLAMGDCLWGALDGMNDAGLAVSLSFGGRRVVGDGFGIPLVVRYLLEFSETAAEAARVLERVPSHMAYNVTVLDAAGDFFTAYLAPDRGPILRKWPLATNHQEIDDWQEYTRATSSLGRERSLASRLADPIETAESLASAFLEPPLYSSRHGRGFGTLYTAVYYPRRGEVEYRWPARTIRQTLDDFEELEILLDFPEGGLTSPRPSSD